MAEEKKEQSQEPAPKKKKSIVKLIAIALCPQPCWQADFSAASIISKKAARPVPEPKTIT